MQNNLALLLALFLSFFITLGWLPLFDLDEGAFSEATREMLESGNYLTTYLNGELRFDKPIFIYWFQALSVKLFGLNEFAVRIPSAIAASLWVFATYFFTARYVDSKKAFIAAFIMIASLQITIIAKAAIADALLNLFIALAMFSLYRLYETRENKFIYFTYLFVGLGALTKGPVAIMVPLVVSFLFFVFKGEWKFWLKSVFNPKGIGIFLLVAAPWYILEYMDQGEKFINGFFFKHNISRFSGAMEGHYGSLVYYIPVFLIGLLPFTALYIKVLTGVKKLFKNDLHLFLIIWFLFVFIFFSFSGTKLPHYVIYGYTPLFILVGLLWQDKVNAFWLISPSILLYLLLIALPIFLNFGGLEVIQDAYAVEILKDSMVLFDWVYYGALVAAVILSLIMIRVEWSAYTKMIGVGILFIMIINGVVLALVAHAKQTPIKEAALIAKQQDLNVTMSRINVPTFIFYSQKKVRRGEIRVGDVVLTKSNKLDSLKKYDIIYKNRGVALVKVEEL
ncbi:MAG TPA: glycosyltransferase family 39 protein [Campylobacterales bacterium]|nr:glycosyltransferase family 39 protein [Campylobacterales bacterium]